MISLMIPISFADGELIWNVTFDTNDLLDCQTGTNCAVSGGELR